MSATHLARLAFLQSNGFEGSEKNLNVIVVFIGFYLLIFLILITVFLTQPSF